MVSADDVDRLMRMGVGDVRRLESIKNMLSRGKDLYNSDRKYLEDLVAKYPASEPVPDNVDNGNPKPSSHRTVFCSKCGNSTDGSHTFCPRCGARIGAGSEPYIPPEKPKKKMGVLRKIGIGVGVFVAIIAVLGIVAVAMYESERGSVENLDLSEAEIMEQALEGVSIRDLLDNNEEYVGSIIHMSGKITQITDSVGNVYYLNVVVDDQEDDDDQVLLKYYSEEEPPVLAEIDFYGRVTGTAERESLLFGTKLNFVTADSLILTITDPDAGLLDLDDLGLEVVDDAENSLESRYPSMMSIQVDETQVHEGKRVTVKTIELAEEHTRVFVEIENSGDDTWYFDNFATGKYAILQDNKQYGYAGYPGVAYNKVKNGIFPNVIEDGWMLLEPIENKSFRLVFGNGDYEFEIELPNSADAGLPDPDELGLEVVDDTENSLESRHPAMRSIQVDETQVHEGKRVTVKTIELAEEHTRVFVEIENSGDDTWYFGIGYAILQDNKQYGYAGHPGVAYNEVKHGIFPNVIEDGWMLLEPIENKSFQLVFGSGDYEFEIELPNSADAGLPDPDELGLEVVDDTENSLESRHPAMRSIQVDETQVHEGKRVTVKTIELAEEHTRVFVEIENSGDDTWYFGIGYAILQDNKQYGYAGHPGVAYNEVKHGIFPNVIEDGWMLLEPIENKSFQLVFGSGDYEFEIELPNSADAGLPDPDELGLEVVDDTENSLESRHPAMRSIQVDETQVHEGKRVTVKTIELAEEHTRVFVEIENSGDDTWYFGIGYAILQDNKQYGYAGHPGVAYNEVKHGIFPNVIEDGWMLLEPIENKSFQLVFGSGDYEFEIELPNSADAGLPDPDELGLEKDDDP